VVGNTGVGKSTFINALIKGSEGMTSERIGKEDFFGMTYKTNIRPLQYICEEGKELFRVS
jgi:ribosome biogenesis GTPase A